MVQQTLLSCSNGNLHGKAIDVACFTAARGTALRWHINKETWGFISYDLAKRLTVSFSSAAFTETT